jgi:hypothetical protein
MGTDTAEMKLARVLPVSSINVRGSIGFRQPGRRLIGHPRDQRGGQSRPCTRARRSATRWRSPPCLPAARLPDHQHLQPDLPTGKHFLGRCAAKEPQRPGMPSTLCISVCRRRRAAGAGNQFPRLILIPRPPTTPALARIDKNRKEPFSDAGPYRFAVQPMARHVSASHAQMETSRKESSSSDGRCVARRPASRSWGVVQEEAWLRS